MYQVEVYWNDFNKRSSFTSSWINQFTPHLKTVDLLYTLAKKATGTQHNHTTSYFWISRVWIVVTEWHQKVLFSFVFLSFRQISASWLSISYWTSSYFDRRLNFLFFNSTDLLMWLMYARNGENILEMEARWILRNIPTPPHPTLSHLHPEKIIYNNERRNLLSVGMELKNSSET